MACLKAEISCVAVKALLDHSLYSRQYIFQLRAGFPAPRRSLIVLMSKSKHAELA